MEIGMGMLTNSSSTSMGLSIELPCRTCGLGSGTSTFFNLNLFGDSDADSVMGGSLRFPAFPPEPRGRNMRRGGPSTSMEAGSSLTSMSSSSWVPEPRVSSRFRFCWISFSKDVCCDWGIVLSMLIWSAPGEAIRVPKTGPAGGTDVDVVSGPNSLSDTEYS